MYRINPAALDEAREMHGLTSDEKLAAELGMSTSALRNLRRGESSPSVMTLMKLRKYTGIPLESLIVESGKIAA